MRYREFCLVCRQRITDVGWDPVCCEICWDSLAAHERRLVDGKLHWLIDDDSLRVITPDRRP